MDRRTHRSDNRAEALELFLASLCRRCGAKSVAVADDDGLLVGGWGDDDLETLAALAVHSTAANDEGVRSTPVRQANLHIVARNGQALPTEDVEAAVVRILDL